MAAVGMNFHQVNNSNGLPWIDEQNKRSHEPNQKLYDFLDGENRYQHRHDHDSWQQSPVMGPGDTKIFEDMRHDKEMAKSHPEEYKKLHFLEDAKSHLDQIHEHDNDPANVVLNDKSYLAEQKYLNSLKPEDRKLLEQVRNEASKCEEGLYPFTKTPQPHRFSPDQFKPFDVTPEDHNILNLHRFAVTQGFGK